MKKLAIMISCIATILVGCNNNTTSEESTEVKRTYNKSINGHEYVDLGLSVKWATCNVGANYPHEVGDLYAWGEIKTKDDYNSRNSETYEVNIGDDIGGNPNYDAATANWGSTWRMPTEWEVLELKNRCTFDCGNLNGMNGIKITGPNGNYIFLPVTHVRHTMWSSYEHGDYWTSSNATSSLNYSAKHYDFIPSNDKNQCKIDIHDYAKRYDGYAIRPVSN